MPEYSIGILIVWMGPLPGWFLAWQRSAASNATIDFHIVTDQDAKPIADNIIVHPSSLEKESKRFSSYFGRSIEIKRPYKFCDFKPFYGLIYEEILHDYNFWGESDLDLLYGNIRSFVTDDVLSEHDRIYEFGDMSLYRNTQKVNELYKLSGSIYDLDEVLNPDVSVAYDEYYGVNLICKHNNIPSYSGLPDKAGILPNWKKGIRICNNRNYARQLLYWEDGEVVRAYATAEGEVKVDRFVLCHWQKRKPTCTFNALEEESFFVTPSSLEPKSAGVPQYGDLLLTPEYRSPFECASLFFEKASSFGKKSPLDQKLYLRALRQRFGILK